MEHAPNRFLIAFSFVLSSPEWPGSLVFDFEEDFQKRSGGNHPFILSVPFIVAQMITLISFVLY